MSRDVYPLRCEDGRTWVPADLAESKAALEALAEAERQLQALKDSDDADTADGQRGKLIKARRRAHDRVPQECMVETGRASIVSVEEIGRNAKVTLRPDHLQDPIHGFLDMTDIAAWGRLQGLIRGGGRCRYHIVVHRQPGVDPTIAWDRVPDRKRIRDLVALEPLDAAAGRAGEPAASAPSSPPVATPPATAPANGSTNGHAPETSGPTCPFCERSTVAAGPVRKHKETGRFAHEKCFAAAAPSDDVVPATTDEAPAPADRPTLRSLIGAALTTVELAAHLLVEHGGDAPIGKVRSLAHYLDDAIEAAKRKGAGDRAAESVRVAVVAVPPPWGQPDRYAAWVEEMSSYAVSVAHLAAELAVQA